MESPNIRGKAAGVVRFYIMLMPDNVTSGPYGVIRPAVQRQLVRLRFAPPLRRDMIGGQDWKG